MDLPSSVILCQGNKEQPQKLAIIYNSIFKDLEICSFKAKIHYLKTKQASNSLFGKWKEDRRVFTETKLK